MSNPIKLRCLDDSSQNMFIVSVNTRASINASTGALVVHNGGLSINSTENALNSFVGGALTVGGGAAFAKDLKVEGGMTIANINLTGELFQNGEPYASSQWLTSTNGNISYTSGSVETTNLNTTNFTVGNFLGVNFTAENLVVDTLNLGISNIFSGSFNASNNVLIPTNVVGFSFDNTITTFQCNLMATVVATSNLYENFNLSGNKTSTGWNLYISSIGDTTGINFFITPSGQLQYTSSNVPGFVSCTFRYVVTILSESGRYTTFNPSSTGSYIFNTLQISGTQQAISGIQTGSFLVDGGATISKNLVVNESLISSNNSNTIGSLITTGGNVGIGINNPASKLDVRITNGGGGGLMSQFGDINNPRIRLYDQIVSTTQGPKIQFNAAYIGLIENSAGGSLALLATNIGINNSNPSYTLDINGTFDVSNSNGIMLFASSGNLGIGTTSPNAPLQLANTISNRKIVLWENTNNNHQFFGFGVNNFILRYQVDQTSSSHVFYASNSSTSSTELMRISGNGNVGIGTNNPGSTLHVEGRIQCALGDGDKILLTQFTNGSKISHLANWGVGIYAGRDNVTEGFISFHAGSHIERMRITTSGNIGIGTSSPSSQLDIQNTTASFAQPLLRITRNIGSNDAATTQHGYQLELGKQSDQKRMALGVIDNGTCIIQGKEVMIGYLNLCLNPIGANVGIGTTSPNYTLDINGTFDVRNPNGVMLFTSAGSLCINTTSPYSFSQLHVKSNNNNSGSFIVLDATNSTSGKAYTIGSSLSLNSSGSGNLEFFDVTSNTIRMIISSIGNVGIGTASPGARLDVRGNMYIGGSNQSNFIAFHGTNGDSPGSFNHTYIGERVYSGFEASELLLFKGNDLNAAGGNIDRIRLLSSEHYFDTYTSEASGTFEAIAATGTTRMVIRNNGNVGIGTSSPNGKLDISGTGNGWGLVIGYSSSDMGGSYYNWPLTFMNSNGVSTVNYSQNYTEYTGRIPSVYNSNGYAGTAYLAFSDRRIKENIEEINDSNALELLRQIQPSTYNYVDKLNRTTKKVYGFIAQQVKDVLPESIEFIKEYLPTIYKKGTITNYTGQLLLKLQEPPTLPFSPLIDTTNTSGNTVYCYTSSGQPATDNLGNQHFQLKVYNKENKEFIVKIQEIVDETTFVLNSSESKYDENETEYFVYGQLANDYHSLDKNYVFTVATAALQEVDRQLQSEKQAHASTASELQETKQRLNSLETFLKSKFPGEI